MTGGGEGGWDEVEGSRDEGERGRGRGWREGRPVPPTRSGRTSLVIDIYNVKLLTLASNRQDTYKKQSASKEERKKKYTNEREKRGRGEEKN